MKLSKPRGVNRGLFLSKRVQVNDNMNYTQRSTQDKGVLIVKEEPIGVIASNDSASFGVLATYPLNPGQATTFPLLSQEAIDYETYLFESLEFFTVPYVSEYATGGQTGEVSIAVNFNASLPQPASQTAALTLDPCDGNLPCLPLSIVCPKDAMHKRSNGKFVRTGNLPGQSDIKEYDVGNLYVTCEGLSASQFNVCRLFVRYRCRLFTRVNLSLQGAPTNNSVTQLIDTAGANLTTATPYTMLLADTTLTDGYVNGLNAVNTSGSILLPAGNYLISYSLFYTATGNVTVFEGYLKKNSTKVPNNSIYPLNAFPSGAYANFTISSQYYVSLNGTDTLQLIAYCTFSTNAVAVNGVVTIAAI